MFGGKIGGVGRAEPASTLDDFMTNRFKPWVEATFREKVRTSIWYCGGIRRLSEFSLLAKARLSDITPESVHAYVAKRQTGGLNVTSINRELQILRRILHLAVEWGAVPAVPKIKLLPGEQRRERVITEEEEALYLAAARREPIASLSVVLADTGLRPEEAFRLRWESITWTNGRHGTLLVTSGKTAAARRVIPLTPRVRMTLETLWDGAEKPVEGWVWPAETRSGHIESSSVRMQHAEAFDTIKAEAILRSRKPVRPFVLYAFRHTFLTRLGESGVDTWTLARIAGHSSIAISSRYVHPSEDAVLNAISRLGGHKIGQSQEAAPQLPVAVNAGKAVH